MVFTDDDLKRAKAEIAAARRMEWPFPDAEALIARLEAAERYIEVNVCDQDTTSEMWDAWQAWRKAAGK